MQILLCLSLLYCDGYFLQSCGHLLKKGCPLGFLVCDVFLCFFTLPFPCPGSGLVLVLLHDIASGSEITPLL